MPLRLGRCLLGCLFVLVAAGCAQDPRLGSEPSAPPTSASTPSSPSPSVTSPSPSGSATEGPTTRDNVEATRAFSAWLLHAVPMPPGAREWRHSPTDHYRHGSVGIGPSDHRFTRTTWWTVSLTSASLRSWLRSHAPRGLRAESDSGGSVESAGIWETDQSFRAPSTAAHTRGWVNFAFLPSGGRLVVRVDTFTGARFARTALVPADATTARIERLVRSTGARPHPHTTVRLLTDPAAVAALVDLVNGLPGAMTSPFVASCPVAMTEKSYSLTFTTPHGSFVASLPSTNCWPRITLQRDGAAAGPPLEPDRRFTRTLDRYLA